MSPLKLNSLNVNQLIESCLNGDANAFEQLFLMYAGKMMTVCRRYASSHSEAEDLLQEGFLRVYQNLGSFEFKGSFEGWVRKIMVNTALRQKISKEKISLVAQSEVNEYEKVQEPDALSMLSEEEILKLIEEMPTGYKIVFNLNIIEGYSHKEIASLLGIEEGTSRSQLVKARRLLQSKLTQIHKIAG